MKSIHFVGAGSGAADLITLRGKKYLEEADTIIYAGSLVNPQLLDYAKAGCSIYNSAKMTLEEVLEVMLRDVREDKQVVRLHTGDPCLYGAIREQMDVLDEEKKILMVQMENDPKMAGKPEQVREKIVMGKLNKFYSENCLLQQEFVKDNTMTVEKYIAAAAKNLSSEIKFADAIRFEKGEGIEKKQENFAAEIASMVKG